MLILHLYLAPEFVLSLKRGIHTGRSVFVLAKSNLVRAEPASDVGVKPHSEDFGVVCRWLRGVKKPHEPLIFRDKRRNKESRRHDPGNEVVDGPAVVVAPHVRSRACRGCFKQ